MSVTCQSINSGLLRDAASSGETHSKASGLIHTTGSHTGILDDALVERRLAHGGVVVGHVRRVEQGRALVISHFAIALTGEVFVVTGVSHDQRTTCSTVRRNVALPRIEASSSSVTSLVSIHLMLEHAQHTLCALWFCGAQLTHRLQLSGRHHAHSVQ